MLPPPPPPPPPQPLPPNTDDGKKTAEFIRYKRYWKQLGDEAVHSYDEVVGVIESDEGEGGSTDAERTASTASGSSGSGSSGMSRRKQVEEKLKAWGPVYRKVQRVVIALAG